MTSSVRPPKTVRMVIEHVERALRADRFLEREAKEREQIRRAKAAQAQVGEQSGE